MHYGLMVVVAVTAVASFELVGNILVVAMLVVPPATAYLLTARLGPMIGLSVLLAAISAVAGHFAAMIAPDWFGYRSTTVAGMMASCAGALLMLAVLFSPREGIVFRWIRHQSLGWRILADDVIALLYRMEERDPRTRPDMAGIGTILIARPFSLRVVLHWLRWRNQVGVESDGYRLLPAGVHRARRLVRSHRLWEQYLASYASLDAERLHGYAEQWEHFTDERLRERLSAATDAPTVDPHGRPIPEEHREP
jgi:manganese/zinc/iron transport system permease protein